MGVTTLQVNLNSQRMIDLYMIKKQRGYPIKETSQGYISDDAFARILLLERIDELIPKKSTNEN
jgi:hypothetical protein